MKVERLEAYVEWNTLTRHQIIVAHLQLVEDMDKVRQRVWT